MVNIQQTVNLSYVLSEENIYKVFRHHLAELAKRDDRTGRIADLLQLTLNEPQDTEDD